MKLIDLLVRELPKMGGWPVCIDEISMHGDGAIFFDGYCAPKSFSLPQCSDGWIPGNDLDNTVARNEYEATLAASQQPAWNGEGLPPVGMGVEWLSDKYGWLGGTVAAHDAKYPLIAIIRHNDGYTGCHRHEIRTRADRKRDEVIKQLAQSLSVNYSVSPGQVRKLYEDIASGKIKGIKLDGDA